MPELPEVETTRRAIEPYVRGKRIRAIVVRDARLRWPIAPTLNTHVAGIIVTAVTRRGKYLLLESKRGALIVHLGMSGSLRLTTSAIAPGPYDHVDVVLSGNRCLRLRDPRRFGAVIWSESPHEHALLKHLGPEPLSPDLNAEYLFAKSRRRKRAIKEFLMDSRIVTGIGNIYANEALFHAGIDPRRAAGSLNRERYTRLETGIRLTLERAIAAGGTTLRDFQSGEGRPGYFQQELAVYARGDKPCRQCGKPIRAIRMGTRSAFYCPRCQR